MKVLILGGSRFIGKRLAKERVEAGDRVTLLNRGREADGLPEGVERLRGDRSAPGLLEEALSGRSFDVAYDFICWSAADARTSVAALRGRAGHLVHVSTCSVYWCTGDFPCPVSEEAFERDEPFPPRPGSIEYEYGYAKRQAEGVLFDAWRDWGFPVTAIRMPVVGGEGDRSLRYASYALRIEDGRPLVLPDSGLAPFRQVYVGDVTLTLAAIAGRASTIGRAYNLAGEEILSVGAVVDGIAALLGRRVDRIAIPSALLGELDGGNAFSPFSRPAAQVPAIERARRELGWSPTPWREWLEAAVRWGIDHCRRTGEVPGACAFRDAELEAARRFSDATSSLRRG